uniref:Zinc finger, CCHC-type n=1 Tax=Tanacetum cinerariifolium TaxID=118510 RepID=A0A6L2NWT9_TANCI|nr:zinc finger, CCHC-type [Tanacetum cinerariifolium]
MHFMLSSMSVVYVLTTPLPEDRGENPTVKQVRRRAKRDNDDYVRGGLIPNGMFDFLFDIYQNVETSKALWDTLKAKYMVEDASSKKFFVSNFTNYKMIDSRPVLKQYNELLVILERFTQHNMNMDESIQVSCIIDKLPLSWKDFKHILKHLKKELTLIELGSHLRIKESLRVQESDKPYNDNKGKRKHHNTRANPNKKPKVTCWKCGKPGHLKNDCKAGNVSNRANGSNTNGSEDGSFDPLKDSDIAWWVDSGATAHVCKDRCWFKTYESLNDGSILHMRNKSTALVHGRGCVDLSDLCDLHATPSLKNKKYFVTFIDDASRFYVIEPNDSVAINSIIELKDAIFDEHRFSSVPRPSQRSLKDGTEDSGGSVVSERVTKEVVQEPESELRKSKRHRTPKDFGPEFQLYLIEGTRDEISDQHSYCFNVEDDPKTFNEAIKPLGCKWIFKRKLKVDGTVEKFKARLVIQGFKQKSEIDYFDTYAPVSRITFLNGELEEEVYMNQPLGFIMPGNENKVCKLIKSLYGLKHALKQWHQKFDEVVLSNGYLLNQADKCVYSKIDGSGIFVIKVLYEGHGEANVILGIMIKHESNGIAISQSHHIENVLKKFNYSDCTPVSTPLDTCEKLMPNKGPVVSQLDNPGTQHWQAIQRVLKYLKKTMDYRLIYSGYPSVLEAVGKEAEWLKNLLLEIPLWVKPIAPISIRCDSAATLAKAYSQMYNGKSRHLGVRHSMIRKLITNEVVSIEFVRSQQNLVDHLTKGLARDLVIKSAEGMGLKSN